MNRDKSIANQKTRGENFVFKWPKTLALVSIIACHAAWSGEGNKIDLNIKAQRTDATLLQLAEVSGTQILFSPEIAKQFRSPVLQGSYTVSDALEYLLAGTDLSYQFTENDVVVIKVAGENSSYGDGENGMERLNTDREIEEMIVTAQKREQSIKDVPISITAMGDAELRQRGINNLEDLGLAVPGLAVLDTGTQRSLAIRGMNNTNGSSALTGFYIDEVPVLGGENGFQQDLPDIRPYDLERVEVLKGPQGTLYGQGSMGGTVRFITKKPDLEQFGVKADVSGSFTKGGTPSQKIEGVLNVPVIENVFGLRIASTFANSGGWIDQPAVDQENINDSNLTHVRAKGLWLPAENMEITMMATVHRNDAGAPSRGEDESGNFTMPLIGGDVTPSLSDDYEVYNLSVIYDFDVFSFLSSTSYTDTYKFVKNLNEGTAVYNPYVSEAEVFNQEIRLTSNADGPLNWTFGSTYKDLASTFRGVGIFGLADSSIPLGSFQFNRITGSKSWAVFGNVSYEMTDRMEIGAGLRYFEDDRKFSDIGVPMLSETFDSTNPRFYVNYDVIDDVMVYASAAKGFRSGGFNTLNQPPYEPESLWTYELGSKASLLGDRLDAEIALFYTEYSDFVFRGLLPPPAPPFSIFSNAGDVEISGVDWALTAYATDNLSLIFNGSYIDAKVVAVSVTGSSHAVGDPVDGIPEYSFTFSANYNIDWNGRPSYVRVDYNQRDRVAFRNRASFGLSESDVIHMMNASIGVQWKDGLSLGLFASNLLNDRGYLDAFSFVDSGVRPRPRTIGFKLGVEF